MHKISTYGIYQFRQTTISGLNGQRDPEKKFQKLLTQQEKKSTISEVQDPFSSAAVGNLECIALSPWPIPIPTASGIGPNNF